ncbi:MAG: glycosyltransferase family 2 protein [Gammaproteobacteria bacterium]|jgi:hyaluronan synthase
MSLEAPNPLSTAAAGGALSISPIADPWERTLRAAIVAGVLAVIYLSATGLVWQPFVRPIELPRWAHAIEQPAVIWAVMGSLLLGFRTLLWFHYRPYAPADMATAPFLTVIIPAYNEGPMVEKSIESVAASRYPGDRLEILVVDDGSKDDTWEHIQRAARRHPVQVTTVRFARNRGKRAALETGFRQARGEVVVTIDSDSVIEPDTLLAMVGPFRDGAVGAVAGRVAVYNLEQGLIPRMLRVRYTLSFDFLRAAQSTYGTVYCCPGALAAYRTSAVRQVLDPWVEQTFLGAACTYGEDRSMTNYILSLGYNTVYQRTAVVHTVVPWTYRRLSKMFLRWDRSYVREELRFAARVVWKRPLAARLIAAVDVLITNLRFPVGYGALGLLVYLSFQDPMTLVDMLVVIGVMSSLHMLYYLRSERSWGAVYGVLYAYYSFFTLFWIFPYAVLTVRARSWLTR